MNNKMIDMRRKGAEITGLGDLARSIGKSGLTLVEIGVYRGQSTECFLDSGIFSKIYCIDPWKEGYDPNDAASSTDMEAVESDFDNRVGSDDRVVKLKGVLDDYDGYFADKEIDVVYIDACHKYENVKNDIESAMRILKPRVAICGHDYSDWWKGVKRAVNDTLSSPDMTFVDSSWIKFIDRDGVANETEKR